MSLCRHVYWRPGGQALAELTGLARTPLSDWPTRYPDRQAMGYLCSYAPVEIIHAAGLTPVRVRGSSAPLRQVDAHLQPFTCALCRSTLDQLLCGELQFLVGTVLAHTCDAMQALADLWRIDSLRSREKAISPGQRRFVDVVMQPTNLGSPAARAYLIAELSRFRDRLAAFVGHPITDDDLRASIALYNDTRQLVRALQQQRDRLSAPDFFAVLDAAQIMPREQFNPLLADLLAALETAPPPVRRSGPGLFLTGAVLDEPLVLEIIEELGARVAGDDLCSGSRHFHDLVGAEDPAPGPLAQARAGIGRKAIQSPPWPTTFCGDLLVRPSCIPSMTPVPTCWTRFTPRAPTASSLSWKSSATPMRSSGRSSSLRWMARVFLTSCWTHRAQSNPPAWKGCAPACRPLSRCWHSPSLPASEYRCCPGREREG